MRYHQILRTIGLCLLINLSTVFNIQAQHWRTFTNPLYKAHRLINDSLFEEAKALLESKKHKIDTHHTIWYHSKSRIALHEQKLDEALSLSKKALCAIFELSKYPEEQQKFKELYYFDDHYLSLFYRQILVWHFHQEKSSTSTKQNNALQARYKSQLVELIPCINQKNVLFKLTYPRLINHLKALNDTIEFNLILEQRSSPLLYDYIKGIGQTPEEVLKAPAQLRSFYIQGIDSLFRWEFQKAKLENTESAFLEYARKYSESPYKTLARNRAEEIAFRRCRESNLENQFIDYLRRYPNGKYRNQAQKLLNYLTVVPVPILTLDGKYRYVDSMNKRSWIDSTYDFAYPFKLKYNHAWLNNGTCLITGCALVMKRDSFEKNKWFYIEKDGTRYNQKAYDEIRQISSNRAFVSVNDRYGIINQFGEEILPPVFEKVYFDTLNKLGIVFNGSAWAIVKSNGQRLTPFDIDFIPLTDVLNEVPIETIRFTDNRIVCLKKNIPWSFDFNGQPSFVGDFSELSSFHHGIGIAKNRKTGFYSLIDTIGNIILDSAENIEQFKSNNIYTALVKGVHYVLVIQNSKISWSVKSNEKPIIANYWGEPQIAIKRKRQWFVYSSINPKGHSLMSTKNPMYVYGDEILCTNRLVSKSRKKIKINQWYNPRSKEMSVVKAEEIAILDNKQLIIYNDARPFLYDVTEKEYPIFSEDTLETLPVKYTDITRSTIPSLLWVSSDSLQYIINRNGRILTKYRAQSIDILSPELVLASSPKGKKQLLDFNNRLIIKDIKDIQYPIFPGFFLINDGEKWLWVPRNGDILRELE